MMDPLLKQMWIADLEKDSNQSKQCEGYLSDNGKFCCLGRLCVVANVKSKQAGLSGIRTYDGGTGALSDKLRKKFGMSKRQASTLMALNDKGVSFKEIAKRIRKWTSL